MRAMIYGKELQNFQENPPKLWLLPTELDLIIEYGRRIDCGSADHQAVPKMHARHLR